MVACTKERAGPPVTVGPGDVRSLDLPDNCCDGARTERVLIHLTPHEAVAAVSELVRVVRPAGRLCLVETCLCQCRIAGDDVLLPSVASTLANPTMGLQLRASLLDAGCVDVVSEPRALPFSTIDQLHAVVRLDVAAHAATAAGAIDDEIASAMTELHRRDEAGTFFAVMLFYVASGTVPT